MDEVNGLLELVEEPRRREPETHKATVRGVVDGKVLVVIDGEDTVTECASSTAACYPDDRVRVVIDPDRHTASVTGNITRKATDDQRAEEVAGMLEETNAELEGFEESITKLVEAVSKAADEAREAADATGQHFFEDGNGAHVTADGSDANILVNALGVLLRTASHVDVSVTRGAVTFYDSDGAAMASYTRDGIVIGNPDGYHIGITASGLALYGSDGATVAAQVAGSSLSLGNVAEGSWNAKMTTSAMDFRLGDTTKMQLSQGSTGHGMIAFGVDSEGYRNIQGRAGSGFSWVNIVNQALGYIARLDLEIGPSDTHIEARLSKQESDGSHSYDTLSSAKLGPDGLTLNLHSSPIGTVKEKSGTEAQALNDGTWKCDVGEIELDSGVWVIVCKARFGSNDSGTREITVGSDTNEPGANNLSRVTQAGCGANRVQTTAIVHPSERSSSTTYYLKAYQNSGGVLNVVSWSMRAVRIA